MTESGHPDEQRYDYGDEVRLIRNVRNDGTYPGMETGDILVRRGSVGNVVEMGVFLQDQVIYTVHFLEQGRMVGCRLEEVIAADAPWNPSLYEFGDKVLCTLDLSVNGNIVAKKGTVGEVMKVLNETDPPQYQYHIRFPGITLQVPESSLAASYLKRDIDLEKQHEQD